MENETQTYVVQSTRRESPTTVTLTLSLLGGGVPPHIAGQFITVYFPELDTPEGKAYSISSAPNENDFSITVRGIGAFSNRLCALREGDTLSASLPYGFFYPEGEESDLVLIASGIGITPFRAIVHDALSQNTARNIAIFHTVRTPEDAFFRKEFEALQQTHPSLLLHYFITQEGGAAQNDESRRITVADILEGTREYERPEFLICGSIAFTGDMWKGLKHEGIPQDSLYTEAFFSH